MPRFRSWWVLSLRFQGRAERAVPADRRSW